MIDLEKMEQWRQFISMAKYDPMIQVHMTECADMLEEAAQEIREYETSLEMSHKILNRVCDALKGKPPELRLYSLHDLGEVAEKVVAQRDSWKRVGLNHYADYDFYPDEWGPDDLKAALDHERGEKKESEIKCEQLRERNEKLVRELRSLMAEPCRSSEWICTGCNCPVDADGNAINGHKHTGEYCKDENNGA